MYIFVRVRVVNLVTLQQQAQPVYGWNKENVQARRNVLATLC